MHWRAKIPRNFQRRDVWRPVRFLILASAIIWAWHCLADAGLGYEWQFNRLWRHFGQFGPDGFTAGPLLKGIAVTVGITGAGLALSAGLGLFIAVLRLSPWPACIWLAKAYVALWRGTPLLLQLFFAYFLLAPLVDAGPFWTAVFTLSAFEGAYMAEVLRAGLLSVPKAQWEAGLSLGLSLGQTLFAVILPQARANAMPALASQAIATLKDSSLVSAIAVADLTMKSQAIVAETFLAFEVWLAVGAIYLLLALGIALPGLWLERRARWRAAKSGE